MFSGLFALPGGKTCLNYVCEGAPPLLNDLPLLNEKTVVEHKQKVLLNDALILHTH